MYSSSNALFLGTGGGTYVGANVDRATDCARVLYNIKEIRFNHEI